MMGLLCYCAPSRLLCRHCGGRRHVRAHTVLRLLKSGRLALWLLQERCLLLLQLLRMPWRWLLAWLLRLRLHWLRVMVWWHVRVLMQLLLRLLLRLLLLLLLHYWLPCLLRPRLLRLSCRVRHLVRPLVRL